MPSICAGGIALERRSCTWNERVRCIGLRVLGVGCRVEGVGFSV